MPHSFIGKFRSNIKFLDVPRVFLMGSLNSFRREETKRTKLLLSSYNFNSIELTNWLFGRNLFHAIRPPIGRQTFITSLNPFVVFNKKYSYGIDIASKTLPALQL